MLEVQEKLTEIAGEIERNELLADFQFATPPDEHIPPSLIAKQIQLVKGTSSEVQSAEREEWRARSQRHKWLSNRLDMAVRILTYDALLIEEWRLKHGIMVETLSTAQEKDKCASGLELFRWSFNNAYMQLPPFARNWNTTYYVRGSYQVLAVEKTVGWHPEYLALLKDK